MPDSLRFSPTVALVTLSRTAEVELARLLEPSGLGLGTFGILSRVGRAPGTSVSQLVRDADSTPEAVAPMVRRLRESGLIRNGDERGATVTITPAGVTLLTRIDAGLAEVDARLFGGDRGGELAAALAAATAEDLGEPQD